MRQLRFKAPKTKQGVRDVTLPTSWSRRSASTARAQLETRLALGLGRIDPDTLVFPAAPDPHGTPLAPSSLTAEWRYIAKRYWPCRNLLHALRPYPCIATH